MARRLARDEQARRRRDTTVRLPLRIRSVSDAVMAAAELVELSTAEATASSTERAESEASALRTSLGLDVDSPIPPQQRSAFKALEENAKRRARRSTTDALDRSLIDLTTFFRDVLVLQLRSGSELVNDYLADPLHAYANASRSEQTIAKIDAIAEARKRIWTPGNPLLTIEAMAVSLRPAK